MRPSALLLAACLAAAACAAQETSGGGGGTGAPTADAALAQPATVPSAEEVLLAAPDDLTSRIPFYAALLQPALPWALPPAGSSSAAAAQRQALLEQLALELAPVVEQVRRDLATAPACCAAGECDARLHGCRAAEPRPLTPACATLHPQARNATAEEISALVEEVAGLVIPAGASGAGEMCCSDERSSRQSGAAPRETWRHSPPPSPAGPRYAPTPHQQMWLPSWQPPL